MMTHKMTLVEISLFVLFLIPYTAIFYFFLSLSNNYYFYMTGYMWSPALATLTLMKIQGKKLSEEFSWAWGKTSFQVYSFLIPLAYGTVAYLIIWGIFGKFNLESLNPIAEKIGLGGLPLFLVIPFYVIMRGLAGTVGNMPSSFGEEFGWRGFLTPRLLKITSFPLASIFTGLLWGIWHFPLIIKNYDHASALPLWNMLINFLAFTIGVSFILTWLLIRSKSLWTAVVLHSAHNVFILSIFEGFTVDRSGIEKYSGESGYVLPAVCLLLGIALWITRKKNQQKALENLEKI
jgi:membrane protease YdiL (CAAX protease family)